MELTTGYSNHSRVLFFEFFNYIRPSEFLLEKGFFSVCLLVCFLFISLKKKKKKKKKTLFESHPKHC